MKLKGRRQSSNVQDRRNDPEPLHYSGSPIQRAASDRVHQEATRRQPKSLGSVTDRMISGMDNRYIEGAVNQLKEAISKRKK